MARHGPLNLLDHFLIAAPANKNEAPLGKFFGNSREGINQDCLTFPWTDGSAHKMTFSRLGFVGAAFREPGMINPAKFPPQQRIPKAQACQSCCETATSQWRRARTICLLNHAGGSSASFTARGRFSHSSLPESRTRRDWSQDRQYLYGANEKWAFPKYPVPPAIISPK